MTRGYVSEIFSSFQGEGLFAGRRHLFLRLAGCNIRCGYCDTPESLDRTPTCTVHRADGSAVQVPNPMTPREVEALLAPFLTAPGLHALALTGGGPLVQSTFLAELLQGARPALPVLLETNGTYPDRLDEVLPFIDIVSMDVKLPSNSGERPFWAEHAAFLRKCSRKCSRRTVYVKLPVDETTSEDEVARAAALVADGGEGVTLFLQPIASAENRILITAARLERFYDLAVAHARDVRVMPQAHKALGIR